MLTTTTQTQNVSPVSPISLKAKRKSLFQSKPGWFIQLSAAGVNFSCTQEDIHFFIPKHLSNKQFKFANVMLQGHNLTVDHAGKTYKFKLNSQDLSTLRAWLPQKNAGDMQRELWMWGLGLILLGVIHMALPQILDPVWGGIIIILGVANLVIPHRSMFIIDGLALWLVGGLNITDGFAAYNSGNASGWFGFGFLQLIWGI